jgi:hypothetical protein
LSAGLYSIAFEGFLALLLVIAIAYCMRLDGKLKALRNGNARMLEAAKELQSSVDPRRERRHRPAPLGGRRRP